MEELSDEMDTPVDTARRCNQKAVYNHFLLLRREERDLEGVHRSSSVRCNALHNSQHDGWT